MTIPNQVKFYIAYHAVWGLYAHQYRIGALASLSGIVNKFAKEHNFSILDFNSGICISTEEDYVMLKIKYPLLVDGIVR